jgi:hypothetical protein
MADLKDLAKRLQSMAADLDQTAVKSAVAIAEAILVELAYSTPVDTSKALSNWQVTTGMRRTLRSQVLPPYFPGKSGSTFMENAGSTIEAGKNALQNKKAGDRILISNVLPYINRLNDGWSAQAPAGFVERAVLIGRKVAEGIIK